MAKQIAKTSNQKTELIIIERFAIMAALPKKGTMATHIVCEDITKKISITQDEIKKYKMDFKENGSINFDPGKNGGAKQFEFTELEKNEIKLCLQSLSDKKELESKQFSVALKFGVS